VRTRGALRVQDVRTFWYKNFELFEIYGVSAWTREEKGWLIFRNFLRTSLRPLYFGSLETVLFFQIFKDVDCTSAATTRRRLQLKRGSSEESALSPPKVRSGGLRGPLFERHRTNTIDYGAISRQSPLLLKRQYNAEMFCNGE